MSLGSQAIQAKHLRDLRNNPIDGLVLKELTQAGLTWLRTNQQTVNSLNVFPVPDGDTGTNMTLTMQSAWNEVAEKGLRSVGEMSAAIAKGALMGARGNSGVILSQLLRGFSRGLSGLDVLDGPSLVRAFVEARDTAYKGVVRPVEGTILTVSKDAAAAAEAALLETQNPIEILERVVAAADLSVQNTPNLLPVLKQAGVVDSGGKGLFFVLEGMLRYFNADPLDVPVMSVQPLSAMNLEGAMESVEEGQDYEVVVDFFPRDDFNLQVFYGKLEEMGTSIQVGEGEGMYRMHIHVPLEKRYEPIDYIMGLGTITKVAMENLLAQMDDIQKSKQEKIEFQPVQAGQIAVVVISPGRGLSRIFASLGVAAIVEGGQTMNPSTQEILAAFENLPTENVIILPNNKNIILAANQAKEVTVKNVAVVPSRTVPQGLTAMLALNLDGDVQEVAERMTKSLATVSTGEITIAVRTVEIDGVSVATGQVIAMLDGKLVLSAETVDEAVLSLLEKADAGSRELITFFYGQDVQRNDAFRIADLARAKYPAQTIEVQDGGQPHYPFLIAVE